MLTQMDVHPGMAAADVDVEGIELSLSAASEEFSFVGARIQGVRLLVEVALRWLLRWMGGGRR